MKKEYKTPEFEVVKFILEDVCNQVVHTSFEHGGGNSGWGFGDDEDDDFE